MDVNLSKLQERVQNRGAWLATVPGAAKSQTWLRDWKTATNGNNNSHVTGLLWRSNEAKNEEYLKCFFFWLDLGCCGVFFCYQTFIAYLDFLSDHQTVILIWISHRHLKYRIFKILWSPDTTSTTSYLALSPTNWLFLYPSSQHLPCQTPLSQAIHLKGGRLFQFPCDLGSCQDIGLSVLKLVESHYRMIHQYRS